MQKMLYIDAKCKGLDVIVTNAGNRNYYFRYTDLLGIQRSRKLADTRLLTLQEARQMVIHYQRSLLMRIDPFAAEVSSVSSNELTLAAFIDGYYLPHVKSYKRSWKTDESLLRNHIVPRFGALPMIDFKREHLVTLMRSQMDSHEPASINRLVVMLRYIFNLAIKWEIDGIVKNPTTGVDLLPVDNKRERFLTDTESQALMQAVKDSDNKMLYPIILMLLLTGARKREVLDAQWHEFDFEQRDWRITKTKLGRARHVPLSDGVIDLLQQLPKLEGCPWVFPNPKTGIPFDNMFCSWNTARKKAGLDTLRIHDLRHSYASFLANNGIGLYEIQKLLGHTQIKTTQRYAHIYHETLVKATNTLSHRDWSTYQS
jgi:integrase